MSVGKNVILDFEFVGENTKTKHYIADNSPV